MSVLPLLMRILDSSNDSCVLRIEKCGWDFGGFGIPLINLMLQRGFSTRFDAELDMRMSQKMTSMLIRSLMNMTTNLKRVFLDYGELKNAPVLARTIVEAREVT
jgi:hypothetical protein